MAAHKIPSIPLTETFKKPADFFGTDREYTEVVNGLAKEYPYGFDGDSARSFQPGGANAGVRIEDVRRVINASANGPK